MPAASEPEEPCVSSEALGRRVFFDFLTSDEDESSEDAGLDQRYRDLRRCSSRTRFNLQRLEPRAHITIRQPRATRPRSIAAVAHSTRELQAASPDRICARQRMFAIMLLSPTAVPKLSVLGSFLGRCADNGASMGVA